MTNAQYHSMLGDNIRQLREECGETRDCFAMDCGCARNTIQNYELGRSAPVYKQFLRICNTKYVSPNQLLAGLFPADSEQEAIQELNGILNALDAMERQQINNFLNIIINCILETTPRLSGASLGTRVQQLRENAGMSVDELAARCMIAKPTLQGYESGQYDPSIPILVRLCDIFLVSPEYLMASEVKFPQCRDTRYLDLFPAEIRMVRDCTKYAVHYSLKR